MTLDCYERIRFFTNGMQFLTILGMPSKSLLRGKPELTARVTTLVLQILQSRLTHYIPQAKNIECAANLTLVALSFIDSLRGQSLEKFEIGSIIDLCYYLCSLIITSTEKRSISDLQKSPNSLLSKRFFSILQIIFSIPRIAVAIHSILSCYRINQKPTLSLPKSETDLPSLQFILDELEEDPLFKTTCPITHKPPIDPVREFRTNIIYEKKAILAWIKQNPISPMTKRTLFPFMLMPMHDLKAQIQARLQEYSDLLRAAALAKAT